MFKFSEMGLLLHFAPWHVFQVPADSHLPGHSLCCATGKPWTVFPLRCRTELKQSKRNMVSETYTIQKASITPPQVLTPYCMDSSLGCKGSLIWHPPRVFPICSTTRHMYGEIDTTLSSACTPLRSSRKELLALKPPPAPAPPRCTHYLKTSGLRLSPTHYLSQPWPNLAVNWEPDSMSMWPR